MANDDYFEPERLRAFVAVAEQRGFTRAAEHLGIAQPTVSIQVRRLEESLGRSLFHRRAGAVELTGDGDVMLGFAREMLGIATRARLQFSMPALEGSVRFGLTDDFTQTALPEILGRLRRLHPRFELFVLTGTTGDLGERIRENRLDLALTRRMPGSTEGEKIVDQGLVWAGDVAVLAREPDVVPLVLTPSGTVQREIVLGVLRAAGRRCQVRYEATTYTGLRAGVLAGMGITAFGVGMVPPEVEVIQAAVGLPPLPRTDFALLRNPLSTGAVVAGFATLLRQIAPTLVGRLEEEQLASFAAAAAAAD